MKKLVFVVLFTICGLAGFSQDEEIPEEKKGFKKENLFTGGSISLSFFNNNFLVGGSPVFGYSLTRWADAGLVINYNYSSYRDYPSISDKVRQSVYGGGAFVRLFPVKFLFVQGQPEYNFIRQKVIYSNGFSQKFKESAKSLLVGGGYTTGREPGGGFFYLAVLFDLLNDEFSPYIDRDVNGNKQRLPIVRAGVHVPLFQGSGE